MDVKKKFRNLWYRITGKEREYVFAPALPGFLNGAFGLSDKAIERLIDMGVSKDCFSKINEEDKGRRYIKPPNVKYRKYIRKKLSRSDPRLIKVIKELGDEALGIRCNAIAIVSIPAYIDVYIGEHGEFSTESLVEKHRTWNARDGEIIAGKPLEY